MEAWLQVALQGAILYVIIRSSWNTSDDSYQHYSTTCAIRLKDVRLPLAIMSLGGASEKQRQVSKSADMMHQRWVGLAEKKKRMHLSSIAYRCVYASLLRSS